MYEFVVALLQPYRLMYLFLLLAVLNLWRQRQGPRKGLVFLTIAFAGLTVVTTPVVAHVALGSLEWQFDRLEHRPAEARAIVVLTSALATTGEDGTRPQLDEDSLLRCQYAVELYRQGPPCPVVVSGGKVDPEAPGPAVACVMADFLRELGVRSADLVVEDASRSTFENAVESARLLKQRQLERVLLVTDAVDMLRAERCFRKQGVDVIPAPCHYRAAPFQATFFTFVPSMGAGRNLQRVSHEWLGMAWYWVQGRI